MLEMPPLRLPLPFSPSAAAALASPLPLPPGHGVQAQHGAGDEVAVVLRRELVRRVDHDVAPAPAWDPSATSGDQPCLALLQRPACSQRCPQRRGASDMGGMQGGVQGAGLIIEWLKAQDAPSADERPVLGAEEHSRPVLADVALADLAPLAQLHAVVLGRQLVGAVHPAGAAAGAHAWSVGNVRAACIRPSPASPATLLAPCSLQEQPLTGIFGAASSRIKSAYCAASHTMHACELGRCMNKIAKLSGTQRFKTDACKSYCERMGLLP